MTKKRRKETRQGECWECNIAKLVQGLIRLWVGPAGLGFKTQEGNGLVKGVDVRASWLVFEGLQTAAAREGEASRSKPLDLRCLSSWLASAVTVAVVVTAAGCGLLLKLPF